jgi:signal transduction histidine kinase/DNA-binding NarL/FixJ family response regulator
MLPKFWKKSLMARLVSYFLLLSLATVGLVAYIAYVRAREALRQSVFDQLSAAATLKEDELNRWVDDQRQEVLFIASLPEVRSQAELILSDKGPDPSAYAFLADYLASVIASKPALQEIFILTDVGGQIILSTDKSHEGAYRVSDNYFTQGRLGTYVQNVYPWPVTLKPTMTIATPLFAPDDQRRLGVLAVHLSLERMDSIVLEHAGLGASGETYLVDRYNVFVSAERFGRGEFPQGVHTEGVDAAVQGVDGSGLYLNHAGVPVIGVYRWLDELELALLAEMHQQEAFAPARRLAGTIILVGLLLAGALTVGGHLLAWQIARPILAITDTAIQVADGDLTPMAPVLTEDEIGVLARVFNSMTVQLRELIENLESQVAARTHRLETVATLGSHLNTILDFDQLLTELVNQVKERFDYYHVQIYILDQAGQDLVVAAGYGEAGDKMKAAGHHVPLDTATSLVARAARSGQIAWVDNVHEDPDWVPNPLLPRTCSEMVVPIVSDDRTVGVLDVQSDRVAGLDQADASLLRSLANQVVVALTNARLFEQTLQARLQAEVASQAKSAFLANMSHELRTPLNAILGYTQILRQQPLAPDVINALNTVQRSGEHLLTLINDVLDIAKIEAGRIELSPAPIYFPNFLEHIASITRARAEAKELTFSFDTLPEGLLASSSAGLLASSSAGGLPTWVQADETRLRQVLLNLLDNAVKFTKQGEVVLRVSSKKYEVGTRSEGEPQEPAFLLPTPYSLLRFEVQDAGIGIAPDQLERIFQPFEQVEGVARWTGGTGLGLAISRQLVGLMGGELRVRSEPGQGSTFWFEVALPVAEVAVEAAAPPEQIITGYKGPRRTVLVADDVPSNRAVLVGLLGPLGFEVVEAADGWQAIRLAQETRPDLILMDRWMPGLDGYEAVRQMRQIPELADVVTIAVSASVSQDDQAQSREAGIDGFLPKPVNWPRLAALLQEHLGLEWESLASPVQSLPVGLPPRKAFPRDAPLVPPSQAELAVLHDLVRMGDMYAIRQRAAHIATLGEQFVPFADRLRELARGFEERQILALVLQYMEDKGED